MIIVIIISMILTWITAMTLIIWKMSKSKVKVAQEFFKYVLPKIPITGIVELLKKKQ